jgi:hypothetical protein
MLLEINQDRTARVGLKFFKEDWATELATFLQMQVAVIEMESAYLLSDPNGVKVYLMKEEMKEYDSLSDKSTALPGNFAGLSIEAIDMEKTVEFWKVFSYKQTMGDIEQGWASFDNGSGIGISVMKMLACPHIFYNPGLTFFNSGKNLPVIQKIRAAGIDIAEEITIFNKEGIVDNIIICDPGGLGFFIFND